MKSKKRKWEELVADPNLENRIHKNSESRFKRERIRNRLIGSAIASLVLTVSVFSYTSMLSSTDDLSNNVSFLFEEYDSNPFFYLGDD
jgi:hypothetical protein